MKYCRLFCRLAMFLLLATPAVAQNTADGHDGGRPASQDMLAGSGTLRHFDDISMNVLEGWTATQPAPHVVAVVARDKSASFSLVHSETKDTDPATFAREMSRRLGGAEPVRHDDTYTFSFTNNGVESHSTMRFSGRRFSMITITDPTGTRRADIEAMLATVKEKTLLDRILP